MTIEQFAKNKNTSKKKVIKWIEKGLIPQADLKENYVPDSARKPYTQARAKKASSIYHSIIKASNSRYHVLPQLYGMDEKEFNVYINNLVEAGILTIRESDGVRYYDVTFQYQSIKGDKLNKIIGTLVESAAKGMTCAITDGFKQYI